MHMDGARLWNAYTKHKAQHSLKDWCEPFNTVSLCFSKGFIILKLQDWEAPLGQYLWDQKMLLKERDIGGRYLEAGGDNQETLRAHACTH